MSMRSATFLAFAAWMLHLSACGPPKTPPLYEHFRGHFRDYRIPPVEEMRMSAFVKTYDYPIHRVNEAALQIIAQHAMAIRTTDLPRTIFFYENDGLLIGKTFASVSFPFVVLLEEKGGETVVYVHKDLRMLYEMDNPNVNAAHDQKCLDFLTRVEVQLESGLRWPWLKGNGKRQQESRRGFVPP